MGTPTVLQTGAGGSLITGEAEFSVPSAIVGPVLRFAAGFATEEVFGPGFFGDSFTLTLVDEGDSFSIVVFTMDASGVVFAPPTPGTTPFAENLITRTAVDHPSLDPVLPNTTAFDFLIELPEQTIGRGLTAYFDLFDNADDRRSQAWFTELTVVPEPSVWALLLLGAVAWGTVAFLRRVRKKAVSNNLALLGLVLLALHLGATQVAAQETFRLGDADVTLDEATPDAAVYFTSMRLNRALNVWNVEVAVTNTSAAVMRGPLVLLVDDFSGTAGPQQPDGMLTGGKAYFDLSGFTLSAELAPGEGTARRTLTLGRDGSGSPVLTTRFFVGRPPAVHALGVTRSLDEAGRPLPGVALTIEGPQGTGAQTTDTDSGVASFGQGPGSHWIQFSADGYLPVWRREDLSAGQTARVPNPRLTRRSPRSFQATPLTGIQVTNNAGTIVIDVGAGVVGENTSMTLTALTGQNLPAFLPPGWSPLNAFWLESSPSVGSPLNASLVPSGRIDPGETAALVRWNTEGLFWEVATTLNGDGTNALTLTLPGVGAYALVVEDVGETAPPPAIAGERLRGFEPAIVDPDGLTARGDVTPPVSPASREPELVTGLATVELRHDAAPLHSGYLLRGEVTESYLLADGSLRLTPQYEHFIVGYQRPGDQDPNTLHARFPMRPLLLFGVDELDEAAVRVDVLPEGAFDGTALDDAGGQLASDGVRILVGEGRLTGPSALRLRRLDATPFTNLVASGHTVIAAFDLTVDASTVNEPLAARLNGAPANARFVLARVLSATGFHGLQPVERLASDAAGGLSSLEPTTGERLPGLRGSGQFVLIQVAEPQGLIGGVAVDGSGLARAGMPVRVSGLPWVTLTDADGRYRLVAPLGGAEVGVTDPVTGDTGFANITVSDPAQAVEQDLGASPSGPRVASISPADNAERVPRVTSVVVRFNEAVDAATVTGDAVLLLAPDDSVIPASLGLNLSRTVATLSPSTELAASTRYRVRLSPDIADPTGLTIEGAVEFAFTTVAPGARVATAQLVIYEPGATNVPVEILNDIPAFEPGEDPFAIVVHGQPGVADPEVPVVLVNESTGETQTVLSKPDGGFSSFISGTEEDFISATFVNLNGTRVYVPVSRQEFDDGFVGLYPQGGILEAESDGGPVRVLVEPGAIENKAKIRIEALSVEELRAQLGDQDPLGASFASGAINLEMDGERLERGVKVSIPSDLAEAGYPADQDPAEAALALTVVRDRAGEKSFEVIAPASFSPDAGSAPGAQGAVPRLNDFTSAGIIEASVSFLPGGDLALGLFRITVVPMLIGNRPVVITGTVIEAPESQTGNLIGDLIANQFLESGLGTPLGGAFISLYPASVLSAGLPGRLRPGAVYASSGRDGTYLIVAPTSTAGYHLLATHPRFEDKQAQPVLPLLEFSIAGAVRKDFAFNRPLEFQSPPTLNIAHAPLFPAPGESVTLQINASQGAFAAPTIEVTPLEPVPLAAGVEATIEDVVIEDESEQVVQGNRKRYTATIRSEKAVRVRLQINVSSGVGGNTNNLSPFEYSIDFDGDEPPPPDNTIPPSDPNDDTGPMVIASFPADNDTLPPDGRLVIRFNEPVDRLVEQDPSGITVTGGSGGAVVPGARLNDNQQELTLQFAGLEPGATYSVVLSGQSVRDLSGNELDQKPSTATADGFTVSFRAPSVERHALTGVDNGASVTINGNRLYALDRGAENALLAYDISIPGEPQLLSKTRLPGRPRDVLVIPEYSYRLKLNGPVATGELVVVAGGDVGGTTDQFGNVYQPGQFLRIYDMSDAASPVRLASPVISLRIATVNKVRWAPPLLAYLEFGADTQFIGTIDLQEMLIGFNATAEEAAVFPPNGLEGEDLNGDGDYVDDGETVPVPGRNPAEFFGKKFSYVLDETSQPLLDFGISGGLVGAVFRSGRELNNQGEPTGAVLNASYRTVSFNGLPVDPIGGRVLFGEGSNPKRVTVFDALPMLIDGELSTPSVALVSMAPAADGTPTLVVIDVSLPESPTILNRIRFPEDLVAGFLQSVEVREDGLLELATTRHVFVLDPLRLAEPNPENSAMPHPAVVDFIPQAGAGTFTTGRTLYGVFAVTQGGRNEIVQVAPSMSFVSFPGLPGVLNPAELPADESFLSGLLGEMREAGAIIPARYRPTLNAASSLDPPSPEAHYHVMVNAPGGSGEQLVLGLESLNPAGKPRSNPGLNFPPVRAVSAAALEGVGQEPRPDCDAPVRSLTAYRMSDDPRSPHYNRYLSKPFALTYEKISIAELTALRGALDREILWSASYLRAFIDPSEEGNAAVGAFAARIDADVKQLRPRATTVAPTLDVSYIMGRNPSPPGGYETMPGSFGTVSAHSGEFRSETTDMALPSPRMPIEFERAIGGQDMYEGPFGRGWDFNFNQRLTELSRRLFPEGLEMPLIARDNETNSVVAGSRDILFHTGAGRMIHYRHVGTDQPPEYASDPLVQEYGYEGAVSDYYLPERGSFDLLVKFHDGRYERLTPGGTRVRYGTNGRLEEIVDRYPDNRHVLEYDRRGWLVRIDDKSVTEDRFLEIGYYRFASDSDFTSELDEVTDSAFLEGKIHRLKDYAGTDVLFFYNDEGVLIRREGPEVAGENDGFSGRTKTHYLIDQCEIKGVAVGGGGTPVFSADTVENEAEEPKAEGGTGIGGAVTFGIDSGLNASNLSGRSTSATQADGSVTEFTYDTFGNVQKVRRSGGPGGGEAEASMTHNDDGLMNFKRHPLGNTETYVYDSDNAVFRSRGNLLTVSVDPGPRGGESYSASYEYDARYNLPSGNHVNANGDSITYNLTGDGRALDSIDHGSAGGDVFTYNSLGQVESHTGPEGIRTGYTYDESTGFIATESRGGNVRTCSYDSTVAGKLGFPSQISHPEGSPLMIKYNRNLQAVEYARGAKVDRMAYDEQGRMVKLEQEVGDGKIRTVVLGYDQNGFLRSSVTSGIEVDGSETSLEFLFAPDELFRTDSITHPGGAVQEFDYNNRGDVVKMTLGDYVEEYEHDLHGNLVLLKQGGDAVETTVYDGHDRPVEIRRNNGSDEELTSMGYFKGGQDKTVVVTDPTYGVVQDVTTSSVDEIGRPLTVEIGGGEISPSYSYDWSPGSVAINGPRQTVTTTWDDAGYATGYSDAITTRVQVPDGNGNMVGVTSNEDGATYTAGYEYDELDNRELVRDALGTRFTYEARADGNFLRVINARGHVTTMEHTALGELTRDRRQDGMEFNIRHNTQREVSFIGDPLGGFDYTYDASFRLVERTLRDGSSINYDGFDPRRMPQNVTLPGGSMSLSYDRLKRITSQSVTFEGTQYVVDNTYDALNRLREVGYGGGGGNQNSATFDYDPAGPLLNATFNEGDQSFEVKYGYYGDGTRQTITYPSGLVVAEDRDLAGRLTGLSDPGGTVYEVLTWQGNAQPREVTLGTAIEVSNAYDARGRLLGRRATRTSDGEVLVNLRFQYDAADNVEAIQYLHRNGRADLFAYDEGERLVAAHLGALPSTEAIASRSGDYAPVADFLPGFYARGYEYESGGLDYLTRATIVSASTVSLPPFASGWSGHDGFLQPNDVDGFTRTTDALGHVERMQLHVRSAGASQPATVGAALAHNGLGHLVEVGRDDGLIVTFASQPDGIRHLRAVSQGGADISRSAFVHDDQGKLIEEYETTGGGDPVLVGRWIYGDGDAPIAADLRNGATGDLERYFYLMDAASSVVALADAAGNVVERVHYDPYGMPMVELRDVVRPVVNQVIQWTGGDWLIVLSESVTPYLPDPGLGTDLVTSGGESPASAVVVFDNSTQTPIAGTAELVEDIAGFPFGSVVRFAPLQAPLGEVSINLLADRFSDEWGNRNLATVVTVTPGGDPGTVLFENSGAPETGPARRAWSSVGSPFVFHGQYLDAVTGLYYLRARYYDPFAGMFIEPDPLGYEDSVNLYAGFGNNPVSYRDPFGTARSPATQLANRALRQNSTFLANNGLSDLEMKAIINVMAKRQQNIKLSIRKFQKYDENGNPIGMVKDGESVMTTAHWRRKWASEGLEQKGAATKAKNGTTARGEVVRNVGGEKRRVDIVSDVDALHVEIDGRFASLGEVRSLFKEINMEYSRLFRQSFHRRGVKPPRTNPPFQHEAAAHLGQQLGNRIGQRISKSGKIDMDYIKGVGHPGDAFVIESTGRGRVFSARDLSRKEVDEVLQRGEGQMIIRQLEQGEPAVGWPSSWDHWKDGTRRSGAPPR